MWPARSSSPPAPLAEDAPQRLPAFRNALRGSGDKHAAAEGGKTALYPRLQWEYLERSGGGSATLRKGNALWKCQLS